MASVTDITENENPPVEQNSEQIEAENDAAPKRVITGREIILQYLKVSC